MLTLLWQAVSWMTHVQIERQAHALEHFVAVHGHGVEHHHHNQGHWHLDDESGHSAHQHSPQGVQALALVPHGLAAMPAAPVLKPVIAVEPEPPGVILEGPLRPPQSTTATVT